MLMPRCPPLILAALAVPLAAGRAQDSSAVEAKYRVRRLELVERFIAGHGIKDTATLRAMRTVPRHEFVPPEYRTDAYADYPLPIGYGQTISQPYIVAYMT